MTSRAQDATDPVERHLVAAIPDDAFDAGVFLGELRARLFDDATTTRVRIGRYTLHERIGQGGAGAVYRGHDPELDRDVAIKLLRPELAWAEELLLAEGQRLAALNHPNVVRVFDVGSAPSSEVDPRPLVYVVMELVRGLPLRAWLEAAPRSREAIIAVHVAAARGLAAAHARGIVHRDFKPGNVVVGDDGRVQLLDFGLACLQATPPTHPDRTTQDDDFGSITGGTPAYMSPEQRRDLPVDALSDQYSFCVTLWESLTGERRTAGGGAHATTTAAAQLPRRLRAVLERGLSQRPEQRWPSMLALVDALQRPRRRGWMLAGAGALVAAGALAVVRPSHGASEGDDACASVAKGMDTTWSTARVESLDARLGVLATTREDWQHRRPRVDAWVQAWRDALADTCSAHDENVDLRAELACFEGASTRLRLALDDLDGTDDAAALQRLADLPLVDTCAAVHTPCSDDIIGEGAAAIEVQASRGSLPEAHAGALAAYEAAVDAPPVCSARAALRLGRIELVRSEVEAAQTHLEAAIASAGRRRAEDLDVMAAAGMSLVELFGRHLKQADEARRWARRIEDALPEDHPMRPALQCQLGGVETAASAWPAARALLRGCIDALERRGTAEGRRIGDAYMLLALVEAGLGNLPAAIAASRTSIARFEAATSPSHSLLVTPLANLGAQLAEHGETAEAEVALSRSLAIAEQRLGADHPAVLGPLLGISRLARATDDPARAVATLTRALSVAEQRYPAWHPLIAGLRCELVPALLATTPRDTAAARAQADAAMVTVQRDLAEDNLDRIGCELAFAAVLAAQGELDRGRELLDRLDTMLAAPHLAEASRKTAARRDALRAQLGPHAPG